MENIIDTNKSSHDINQLIRNKFYKIVGINRTKAITWQNISGNILLKI